MNNQRTTDRSPSQSVAPDAPLDEESYAILLRQKARKRELIYLGSALAVGFIVLPLSIYFVGTLTLGPYAGGKSVGAFFAEFFRHLGQGAPRTWFIALSPYLAIWVVRLCFRRNPWGKKEVAEPPVAAAVARPESPNTRREPFISS